MLAHEQGRRMGAFAGFAFIVLSIIAIVVMGSPPKPTDSADKYVSFLVDHRGNILAANMIFPIAFGLLLVFFACVRAHLRTVDPDGPLPTLIFGAGLLFYGLGAAGGLFGAGLAWRGPQGLDPATVRLLADMGNMSNAFLAVPGVLAVGAVAYLVLNRHVLPAWSGWIGVVAAVGLFLTLFTLASRSDFFAPGGVYGGAATFVLLMAWVLATSIALLRSPALAVKPATT